MKIQKRLLYGLFVIGGICILYYLGKEYKNVKTSLGAGGEIGGNPNIPPTPPVAATPVAAPPAPPIQTPNPPVG